MPISRCIWLVITILSLLLLISVCTADISPQDQTLIQGGTSTLSENADGSSLLTIQDPIPYGIIIKNQSYIVPIEIALHEIEGTVNGGIIFSNESGDHPSLVQVSHLTYSPDTHNLTLTIAPVEFYEGTLFADLIGKPEKLTEDLVNNTHLTRVYLETTSQTPENVMDCDVCIARCCKNGICSKPSVKDVCDMLCTPSCRRIPDDDE